MGLSGEDGHVGGGQLIAGQILGPGGRLESAMLVLAVRGCASIWAQLCCGVLSVGWRQSFRACCARPDGKNHLVKWVPGEPLDCDREELCKRGHRLRTLCGVCPCDCSISFGPLLAGPSDAILGARLIC